MRRSPTCLPHFGHYMACISLCRLLRIQIGHFKQNIYITFLATSLQQYRTHCFTTFVRNRR
nr:uncharacterized protein LOC116649923 isoform X5 [Drosophila virilis]XP_032289102.1 uncharacterized protein LOC116649924 isoform X5 [Drosophila virilis]